MLGSVSINILILFGTTAIVVTGARALSRSETPSDTHRRRAKHGSAHPRTAGDLARGFFAAAGIVTVLIIVRRIFPGISRISRTHFAWIVAVVFTEEIVKLALTSHLREVRAPGPAGANGMTDASTPGRASGRSPVQRALARGWGFAVAENILYLLLLPSRFIVRMILAGTVHLATVAFYTAPQKPHRSTSAVNVTRLTVATAAHTAFNLLLRSLDAIPPF